MRRHPSWLFGSLMVVLAALYLLVADAALVGYAGIVAATVTAILYGVHRHRPRRRLPWWLLASGAFAFAVGSVTALVITTVLHDDTFPTAADAISLGITFPTLLLGLLGLSRSGATVRDSANVIDSLILTAGAGLLAWTFLIDPYLTHPGLSPLQKAVSVAYPLCDVLLLAILVRLAFGVRRSPSVTLLLTSGAALLASDVMFGLSQLNGDWRMGGPIDLGWIIFFAAGGLAALHPSMTALTEPRVVGPSEIKARRTVLGIASLIAPTILFGEAVTGAVRHGVVIAIGSAVLVVLSLTRMSIVATGLRQTMLRERQLRRACEDLLFTTEEAGVERVVRAAITDLLGVDVRHRTALLVHGDGAGPDDSAVSMCYVATLAPALRDQFAGFELALRCPLSVAGSRLGELYVAAGELALVRLQDAARVLAGQTASMIAHIALNREINKRDSEAYFRTLILNAADVILIVDADDRVTYASPSAEQLFRTGGVVGTTLNELIEPMVTQRDNDAGVLYLAYRADLSQAEVEVTVRDLRDEPTVAGLVLTLRDVTERRRLEHELLDRAYLDPLTGLGNRLRFQDDVQAAAAHAAATGGIAGVLLVNIDGFRVINDTMGHDVGDELLAAFGQRLLTMCAPYGPVARLGADEFGVVITSDAGPAEIEQLADSIVEDFGQPLVVGGPAGGSAVSALPRIGIATTLDAQDAHQLLSQADIALSSARGAAPRWRRYEESMHALALRRMQLRADLDQAILDDAFVLHYQPIVELAGGRNRGLEALVRWQHPTLGMIPPLEFIGIAEECGLIVPLGDWVLRRAIETAVMLRRLVPADPPYMSVNVSVRQFRSPGFVQRVFTELAGAGLPADQLTIEITESLVLGDDEQIHADIAALRAAGVRISIDDFGTGYSSLSYLHRAAVDTVKLDKSFVDTIARSDRQYDLVRGIIQLAATLELDVVAEGIESLEHQALLVQAACPYGQGYLFSRPLPESEITGWLAARARVSHATR